ncbi:MAG TPA: homoserine kinase [Pseudomonadales bacterium]|nr:homoserine kinase [Pseudomonadales bacterium]
MAAFTPLHKIDIENFLALFNAGQLTDFRQIPTGIENTNYFVTTTKYDQEQHFVLTLVEVASFSEVPFFLNLTRHLANYGLPVPAAELTLDGMSLTVLKNKPAMLLPRLPGAHLQQASSEHCLEVGQLLGLMHSTLLGSSYHRENPYSSDWMFTTIQQTQAHFDPAMKNLLTHCAELYDLLESSSLPRGIIHGDLFRDNILFTDAKITGVLDFFHASTDFLMMDIAITVNDWCRNQDQSIDPELEACLLRGYEMTRSIEPEERDYMTTFQQIAAARFALTRSLTGLPGNYLKDPKACLLLLESLAYPRT